MVKNGIIMGTLILTLSGSVTRLLGFVYRIYLSNVMGPEGMGLYQLIIPLYMLAATVTTAGFSLAVNRLVAEERAKKRCESAARVLHVAMCITGLLGTCIGLFLFLNAEFVGNWFLKDIRTITSVRLLAPSFPFIALSACLHGYFYGVREVVKPASAQVLEQLVRMCVVYCIIGLWLPNGLESACAAAVIGITSGEVVSCIYAYILYRSEKKPQFCKGKAIPISAAAYGILKIALPVGAGSIISNLLSTVENILIPMQLQLYGLTHADAMSAYGMLSGMAMPILFFPSSLLFSLIITLIPRVSEANALKNTARVRSTVSNALRCTSLLSIGAVCMFITFSNEICIAIYNNRAVGDMLRQVALVCPFMYIQLISAGMLNSLGYQASAFKYNFIESAVSLSFVYFLIPRYGFNAYLWGIGISSLVGTALNLNKLLKVTCVVFDLSNWFVKPALSALSAGLVSFYAGRRFIFAAMNAGTGVILGALLAAAIFFVFLFLFGGVTMKELYWLKDRLFKSENESGGTANGFMRYDQK